MFRGRIKNALLVIILICAALFAGAFGDRLFTQKSVSVVTPRTSAESVQETITTLSAYPFINKAITSDMGKHFIINFKPLRMQMEDIQKKYPQKTYAYFIYLNNDSWVGLNERDKFTAASMVKVPLALTVYKAVEDGRLSMTQQYTIDQSDLDPNFGDLYKTALDKTFTLQELVKIMLEQSDNTAKNAIMRIFADIGNASPLTDVYSFFGWAIDFGADLNTNEIDLKTLSNMFLSLYDAHYVNVEHSNQILDYLSRTPFNDKIDAGVPDTVTVSHKIGISSGNDTFSDCGVVYAPNRDYLLCVGSNGADEKTADTFMVEESKAVYDYVMNN